MAQTCSARHAFGPSGDRCGGGADDWSRRDRPHKGAHRTSTSATTVKDATCVFKPQTPPHTAGFAGCEKRRLSRAAEKKKREAPPGFEPGMADLQSAALATWLRRQRVETLSEPLRTEERDKTRP